MKGQAWKIRTATRAITRVACACLCLNDTRESMFQEGRGPGLLEAGRGNVWTVVMAHYSFPKGRTGPGCIQ